MTAVDLELSEGESILTGPEELLYRQIIGHMLDGEKIATRAFGPMPADKDKPSFSRSSRVSAQDARDWHTRKAKKPSLGVRAVSVGEVIEAGRYAIDDSEAPLGPDEERAPGHCYVDFRGLTRAQRKELAARLWLKANERGEVPTTATLGDGELFA